MGDYWGSAGQKNPTLFAPGIKMSNKTKNQLKNVCAGLKKTE